MGIDVSMTHTHVSDKHKHDTYACQRLSAIRARRLVSNESTSRSRGSRNRLRMRTDALCSEVRGSKTGKKGGGSQTKTVTKIPKNLNPKPQSPEP